MKEILLRVGLLGLCFFLKGCIDSKYFAPPGDAEEVEELEMVEEVEEEPLPPEPPVVPPSKPKPISPVVPPEAIVWPKDLLPSDQKHIADYDGEHVIEHITINGKPAFAHYFQNSMLVKGGKQTYHYFLVNIDPSVSQASDEIEIKLHESVLSAQLSIGQIYQEGKKLTFSYDEWTSPAVLSLQHQAGVFEQYVLVQSPVPIVHIQSKNDQALLSLSSIFSHQEQAKVQYFQKNDQVAYEDVRFYPWGNSTLGNDKKNILMRFGGNVDFLGVSPHASFEWVLLAHRFDKTKVKDRLFKALVNRTAEQRYPGANVAEAAYTGNVEVFIDHQYQGLYVLSQVVKQNVVGLELNPHNKEDGSFLIFADNDHQYYPEIQKGQKPNGIHASGSC